MKSFAKLTIVLLVLSLFISCAKKNPDEELKGILKAHADTNINQFILDKFKDHRVVMLADAGHGQGIYMRSVTSFLNYWIDAAKKDKGAPRQLVLVLESDSLKVAQMMKYINSHNFQDIFGEKQEFNPYLTTASLEYYHELGNIIREAAAENLKFLILGPEMIINEGDWSFGKRDTFFVNNRDTISTNSIINYLKVNPDIKALIYYGVEHFKKDERLKETSTLKAKGHFMAYYLDQEYGRQLYRIMQLPVSDLLGFSASFSLLDSSYIVEQKHIQRFLDPQWARFDAIIAKYEYAEPSVSLFCVKSNNVGELALNHLKDLFPIKNDYYFAEGLYAAGYLSVLTGGMETVGRMSDKKLIMASIPKWEERINDPHTDIVNDIIGQKSNKRLLELMKNSDKSISMHCAYLFTLYTGQGWDYDCRMAEQGRKRFYDDYDLDDADYRTLRLEKYEKYFKDNDNKIVITDLVQLLWVGTEKERQKAVEELQKRTGQKFITTPEWMAWWQANYEKL